MSIIGHKLKDLEKDFDEFVILDELFDGNLVKHYINEVVDKYCVDYAIGVINCEMELDRKFTHIEMVLIWDFCKDLYHIKKRKGLIHSDKRKAHYRRIKSLQKKIGKTIHVSNIENILENRTEDSSLEYNAFLDYYVDEIVAEEMWEIYLYQ